MPAYTVALDGDYTSLGKEIERIARETGQTKSNVIRDALCTYYHYKPAKAAKVYSKKYA